MDSATIELYLQKIEEFLHDEDKIITLKWLTTTLDINVKETKKLLQQYISDQRDIKPDALSITYVLSGILKDKTLSVTVVKENELEDKKDLFGTILSKEIYSIQKNKDIDINTVSMVDYFDIHNCNDAPPVGSIISKASVKRVFKQKKALPPPREPTIKGKISVFTKIPPKTNEKVDKTSASPKQSVVKDAPKPKSNGIASFFNKSLSQGDTKPKTQEKPIKIEIKSEVKQEAQKETESIKESKTDRFKNLIDSDSETEESCSQSQSVTSKPSKENQKPKRNNKRQRKENKKNAPSPKRRRRIVEQEDSDDDIFGNNDDDENMQEDLIQISDEDEPVMLPKAPLPPKNKKRKLVDRTFTDDEGFIITRKEWVEESASEDEVDDKSQIKSETEITSDKPDLKRKELENGNVTENNKKPKKEINDSSNDKVVNGKAKGPKGKKPVATNQPTLMNFFKRS